MKYNLFIGLSGGFGGVRYYDTLEFSSEEEALDYAYQAAIEEYEGYGGLYGLETYDSIMNQYCEDNNIENILQLSESDIEDILDIYNNEIESWICYEVKNVTNNFKLILYYRRKKK